MLTFCVITGPETAEGFRLAGVNVIPAESPDEAERKIRTVLAGKGCGLLLVDEELYEAIGDSYRLRLEREGRPVIVPLPIDTEWRKEEKSMEYLLRLIRRSIGYHMRLKK